MRITYGLHGKNAFVGLQSLMGRILPINTLHVLTLLGVAASVCTELPTPSNVRSYCVRLQLNYLGVYLFTEWVNKKTVIWKLIKFLK